MKKKKQINPVMIKQDQIQINQRENSTILINYN